MGRIVRGKLVEDRDRDRWFIDTGGGRIFLPSRLEPLATKSSGNGLISLTSEFENRARRANAEVICCYVRHGKRRKVKFWLFCPLHLVGQPVSLTRRRRRANYHRRGPCSLLRAG